MRGIVLAYDRESGTGLIRAEDGSRYGFRAQDWRERSMPIKGVYVDFEADGPLARDLYVMMPPDDGRDGEPVSFVAAMRTWISNHPEALVASLILIACALPFYRFLGIETTLFQAPEILLRLTSGLERIRALAQQVPSAATAAAIIKMLLPGLYVLWLIPLLAVWVLYRALFDMPRLGLLRMFGATAVLLPILVPLMVVVPTWFLVVSAIPDDQQVTLAYSVFDLPRFGPLRELALGAVATMVLGLGLFLWSINPDNVDERASRRQGITHRHGRRDEHRHGGLGQGPAGSAESFAPPRLRTRQDPQMPPMQAAQARQAGRGPGGQGGQGGPNGPGGQALRPQGASGHPGGPQPGGPQHPHPGQHQPQPQPQLQPQPRHAPPFPVEEGAPHHDPIPESLRRRFEERNQGQGQPQGSGQPGAGQNPVAAPQAGASQQLPPGVPPQLPPPDPAPPAQPDHDPFSEGELRPVSNGFGDIASPSANPRVAEANPQAPRASQPDRGPMPGLPDARDGTGMPADVQISGWSVNPGAPRYDFEALNPPGNSPSAQPRSAQSDAARRPAPRDELADSPYAALARQLGLDDAAARKLAESHTAPVKPRDPGVSAGTPPQAQRPGAPLPGSQRSDLQPAQNPPAQNLATRPPAQRAASSPVPPTSPKRAESLPPSIHEAPRRQPLPPPPPPPDEVTEFLRALNEPDGLRKLAQSAPAFTGETPAKSSGGGKATERSGSAPDDPLRRTSDARARQSGASPPPGPLASSGPLDSALDRAMTRLNGPGTANGRATEPSIDKSSIDKPVSDKPVDEPDSVTELYERLRRERETRDAKPTIPIPPIPPRR
jgi:hypothetical protein